MMTALVKEFATHKAIAKEEVIVMEKLLLINVKSMILKTKEAMGYVIAVMNVKEKRLVQEMESVLGVMDVL